MAPHPRVYAQHKLDGKSYIKKENMKLGLGVGEDGGFLRSYGKELWGEYDQYTL